jgi:K+ transporter
MRKFLTIALLLVAVFLRAQTRLTPKVTVLSGKVEGVELLLDQKTETGWFPG